jgi:hypothetical protein
MRSYYKVYYKTLLEKIKYYDDLSKNRCEIKRRHWITLQENILNDFLTKLPKEKRFKFSFFVKIFGEPVNFPTRELNNDK